MRSQKDMIAEVTNTIVLDSLAQYSDLNTKKSVALNPYTSVATLLAFIDLDPKYDSFKLDQNGAGVGLLIVWRLVLEHPSFPLPVLVETSEYHYDSILKAIAQNVLRSKDILSELLDE